MPAELLRALGALLDRPAPEHAPLARLLGLPDVPDAAQHTALFGLNLYPYASVHLGSEGMLGGEARDRVAGFWRALGMTPPAEPDHLGALLGLLAALEERGREARGTAEGALWMQARDTLLREHLQSWLPLFLVRVREVGGPFWAAWADLVESVLAQTTGPGTPSTEQPLPLHLRTLPPLPDPRREDSGGAEAFLAALLASARCGMILTRQDLARAGRALDLGVRLGERAYVLKALLAQDAAATLRWLAGEARRQAEALGRTAPPSDLIAFWKGRADAAASLLDELASTEALSPPTRETGVTLPMEATHA